MQGTQLRYAIKFVADMDKAVKFHRDGLGLKVKFESPGWSNGTPCSSWQRRSGNMPTSSASHFVSEERRRWSS
jgi:hypothetical protein